MIIKDITGINDPLITNMNKEAPSSISNRFLINDKDKYVFLRTYDLTEIECPFYFSISSNDNKKIPKEIINNIMKSELVHQELINQYNLTIQTSKNNITHVFPVSKKGRG